jgi:hypothetical protein
MVDWLKARIELVTALLAFIAGAATFAFLILPNYQPVTSRAVEIVDVSVEPGLTLDQYLRDTTKRLVRERPDSCIDKIHSRLRGGTAAPTVTGPTASGQPVTIEPGASAPAPTSTGLAVHFNFTATGFAGECVAAEHVVFDAATGHRVGERQQFSFEQGAWETPLREADAGSGELWIEDAGLVGLHEIVVRVELYSYGEKIQRLTFRDTERLCLPAAFTCPDASSSS